MAATVGSNSMCHVTPLNLGVLSLSFTISAAINLYVLRKSPTAFSNSMPSGAPVAFLVSLSLAFSRYSCKFNKIFNLFKLGMPNVPTKSGCGFLNSPSSTTDKSSATPTIAVFLSSPVILIKSMQPRSCVCSTKSLR